MNNNGELVSTTYFFATSANGDGTNSESTVIIPEESLRCSPGSEYLVVSLQQHSMLNQLYNVTNGVIVIDAAEFLVPRGSYSFSRLQQTIARVTSAVLLTFTFDCASNKWTVANSTASPTVVTLTGDMQRLLGFPAVTTVPAGASVESTAQALPTLYTELLFELSGVSLVPLNLTNVGQDPNPRQTGQEVRATNVLGIVPITACPGALNVWVNDNDTFSARIFGENISTMTFTTKDVQGQLVPDLPPWTATFKVCVYKIPGATSIDTRLESILEYTRLMFLIMSVSMVDGEDNVALNRDVGSQVVLPLVADVGAQEGIIDAVATFT